MSTDEAILKEMLGRAIAESDGAAAKMFCLVVQSNALLVHKSQELIMNKINSNIVAEAIKAIELLEECMHSCGSEFQEEVNKFRFLNGLIRVVSDKFDGSTTPLEIRKRIMDCLLLWTAQFPEKTKIREAYDNLKKSGFYKDEVIASVHKNEESVLGKDEQVFSKLVKSSDPEDLKRANKLVQFRINQETKRNELLLQHKNILQEVDNTVTLLEQMLQSVEQNPSQLNDTETMCTLRELYVACKKNKPILERLPELEEKSDELIVNAVEVNEALHKVLRHYKNVVVPEKPKESNVTTNTVSAKSVDFLTDLLVDNTLSNTSANTKAAEDDSTTKQSMVTSIKSDKNGVTLDELRDIFGAAELMQTQSELATEMQGTLDLLIPETVSAVATASQPLIEGEVDKTEKRLYGELKEIDKLSDELFKNSLQKNERIGTFKKDPEKVTLNDLAKERMNTPAASTQSVPIKAINLDSETNLLTEVAATVAIANAPLNDAAANALSSSESTLISKPKDEEMLLTNCDILDTEAKPTAVNIKQEEQLPFKHLSEIAIDLDDIEPIEDTQRILLDDEDVKITLNFAKNRPSKNVSVIVMSATNKGKELVKDLYFDASVRKPSKVRLLTATDNCLQPKRPFRAVVPVNQILLLFNPTGATVDLTCIVGYTLGDDPDPIKESIIAKSIPYVE